MARPGEGVVGFLAGELDRRLQRRDPVEDFVDPLGRQRAGELHGRPVADGDVLVVHLDLGRVLLRRLGLDVVARDLLRPVGAHRFRTPAVRGVVAQPRLGGVEHRQLLHERVQVDELLLQEEQVGDRHLVGDRAAVDHHVGAGHAVRPVLGRGDVEEPGQRAGDVAQDVLGLDLHPRRLGGQLLALLVLRLVRPGDAGERAGLLHGVVRLAQLGERLALDALLHGDDLVQLRHDVPFQRGER